MELFVSKNHRAAAPAATAPAPAALSAPAPAAARTSNELAAGEVLITAPTVGIFYASPQPGAPAFVEAGDAGTAHTVLGIVEVMKLMKLMNNIEAVIEGAVTRILVENEQAVEYDQRLFVISGKA
ncbi:acetyl-CoA carboxylase biotin carboxyl carrier protein [Arthrobacter sulfonylureivorans]|uniref:Biotin carboxyl carrier protein of acetyl-CoA carboxylase n=1 Tax=Arthrobacter sulfonylureivorans TaxID=2486855 RepID=A0ABY3WBM4_9MICC|nr:biotin/lipoyl-containing protein [Arthrobacter sulfonylureivorans]UNK47757.1 hypothetical protein MNQ99_18715 [Arthrobacter sulfonylureivorans]